MVDMLQAAVQAPGAVDLHQLLGKPPGSCENPTNLALPSTIDTVEMGRVLTVTMRQLQHYTRCSLPRPATTSSSFWTRGNGFWRHRSQT